jgi:NhaA family Na+:H+ antiporter
MKHPSPGRLAPFQEFAGSEARAGLLLFLSALFAFAWANSPWAAGYLVMKALPVGLSAGGWVPQKTLVMWVNDGLMVLFFFVVGLEIKRELFAGELAIARKAALAVFAAVGGMLLPALIYVAVTRGSEGARGRGIPMATDIAFALGVASLLGSRAPVSLKVLLTALAIVDDIGAVAVIAVFYTSRLDLASLGGAGLVWVLAFLAGRRAVRAPAAYAMLGLLLWYFTLKSGVHATVAGILLAFTVPMTAGIESGAPKRRRNAAASPGARREVQARARQGVGFPDRVRSPLHRFEHALHPWVAYGVMPIFALFNAGVPLSGGVGLTGPVAVGAMLGLFLGKPFGILGCTWIAVRSGLAALPEGLTWKSMLGLGMLAGIGFTMSLFIAALAFGDGPLLAQAKVGVLLASLVSAVAGFLVLFRVRRAP